MDQEDQESKIARISGAHELGLAFFRTLVLLNSGALVVLMTYIGNTSSDAVFQFSLLSLRWSIGFFLVGIVSIMLALIVSYLFTALNPSEEIKSRLDRVVIPANVKLAALSLTSFVLGVSVLLLGARAT